jgi:hypothetical protein
MAQLRITARMYIGAPSGRPELRGTAARRSVTKLLGPFGLRAAPDKRKTLYAIAPNTVLIHNDVLRSDIFLC